MIDVVALANSVPHEGRTDRYLAWHACVRELIRTYPADFGKLAAMDLSTDPGAYSPLVIGWIYYSAVQAGVPKEQLDAVTVLHLS